jgi:hypothetical protein
MVPTRNEGKENYNIDVVFAVYPSVSKLDLYMFLVKNCCASYS